MTESGKVRADSVLRALTLTASLTHSVADLLISNTGQSLARWQVLDQFAATPATVPSVARRLQQTRQSTQRIADILLKEGLIDRRENPDHRTSPLFVVTAAGAAVLHDIADRVRPWLEYVDAGLTPSEQEAIVQNLDLLRALAREYRRSLES